jgi:hypothetical protein
MRGTQWQSGVQTPHSKKTTADARLWLRTQQGAILRYPEVKNADPFATLRMTVLFFGRTLIAVPFAIDVNLLQGLKPRCF